MCGGGFVCYLGFLGWLIFKLEVNYCQIESVLVSNQNRRRVLSLDREMLISFSFSDAPCQHRNLFPAEIRNVH